MTFSLQQSNDVLTRKLLMYENKNADFVQT